MQAQFTCLFHWMARIERSDMKGLCVSHQSRYVRIGRCMKEDVIGYYNEIHVRHRFNPLPYLTLDRQASLSTAVSALAGASLLIQYIRCTPTSSPLERNAGPPTCRNNLRNYLLFINIFRTSQQSFQLDVHRRRRVQ